jgi:SAM-dependent methyltransferase
MLVYQRQSMWRADTLDRLAIWLGMRAGLTVVDVGCGLGYLGYTFWPYFGAGGQYIGVDTDPTLLRDAERAAIDWSEGGETRFIEGDAYALPLDDGFADIAMCQTLLLHLERPEEALAEMARVVRPGGLVTCLEPDNVSAMMALPFWSLPEANIDEFLLSRKVSYLANQGRIKLGRGDRSIGRKIPHLMSELGLAEIDIRQNDQVHLLEPPYESELQRTAMDKMKKQHLDPERRKTMRRLEREEFVAGGGTAEEYDRVSEIADRYIAVLQDQLVRGTYYACHASAFFVIKGRKAATGKA